MSALAEKLAVRYFKKRLVTWLAVLAVAVSVFISLVVMTVMNGLADEFKEKNHRLFGDCVISSSSLVGFAHYEALMEELKQLDCVADTTAVIQTTGLLSVEGASGSEGVDITGIDPGSFCRVTGFEETLYPESVNEAEDLFNTEGSAPGCIRGIALMSSPDNTGEYPGRLSYSVRIDLSCFPLTAKGTLAKSGTDLVNTKSFVVTNDSNSGLPKIDRSMVYIPFEQAQLLCGMAGSYSRVNAVYLSFKEGFGDKAALKDVRAAFDDFTNRCSDKPYANLLANTDVQYWKTYRREAIAPIEKEQIMLIALFALIGLVTVFVILVVFFLIISHKSRDVGIFKSVGLSGWAIMGVFMRFAAAAGLAGAVLGSAASIVFLKYINPLEDWLFQKYGWQLWDRSLYSIGEIPNDIKPAVVITISLFAVLASLAGAAVPVAAASVKHPADTLRVSQV